MQEEIFNKKQTFRYLIWTFGIAYLIQAAVAVMYANGLTIAYQLVMMAMMFVPLLGTLLSGYKLRNIGWRPRFRGNLKPILIAWLSPVVLTAIGAAVYFLLFPSHLDLSGNSLSSIAGVDAVAQLEAQGISYPIYILITVASSVTYAPAINIFLAVGEEAGWRGFLYPQLKAKFSKRTAWIIGGVIWGMWHWPLIGLIGYEYGSDYFGFPALGMLAFCVITVALGIISDWLQCRGNASAYDYRTRYRNGKTAGLGSCRTACRAADCHICGCSAPEMQKERGIKKWCSQSKPPTASAPPAVLKFHFESALILNDRERL